MRTPFAVLALLLVACSGASAPDLGPDTDAGPTNAAPTHPAGASSSSPPPDAASPSADDAGATPDATGDDASSDAGDLPDVSPDADTPDVSTIADSGPDSAPDHVGSVYCNVAGTVYIGCDGHAHGFTMTADVYTCLANHATIGQCSPGETCTYQPLGEAIQVGVCE